MADKEKIFELLTALELYPKVKGFSMENTQPELRFVRMHIYDILKESFDNEEVDELIQIIQSPVFKKLHLSVIELIHKLKKEKKEKQKTDPYIAWKDVELPHWLLWSNEELHKKYKDI